MSVAISWLLRVILTGLCSFATACVSVPIDDISPTIETLRILRDQNVPSLAVRSFTAQKSVGETINIRGSTMHPSAGKNFAAFLGSVFEAELKAAGKFDTAAPLALTGQLTESRATENFSTGNASLGVQVTLIRGGAETFSKAYRVETMWKSDFIGAIAIPEAFRQYNSLYALLVRKILSDPEFILATKQ